jgi:hypothetical protein
MISCASDNRPKKEQAKSYSLSGKLDGLILGKNKNEKNHCYQRIH